MKRSLSRIIPGYFIAVTMAALCHAAWWVTAETAEHYLGADLLHPVLEMFLRGWIFAFFTALIPFGVGASLELRFSPDGPSFFVIGGALTGVLLVLPRVYFLSGGVFDQSDAPFLERCWEALPRFATAGALAGCGYYLVRRFPARRDSLGRETGSTP
jgi:hypothetical protein